MEGICYKPVWIYIKGGKADCNNYRVSSLLPRTHKNVYVIFATSRIFTNISLQCWINRRCYLLMQPQYFSFVMILATCFRPFGLSTGASFCFYRGLLQLLFRHVIIIPMAYYFLGEFLKLWKSTISSVMSVWPYVISYETTRLPQDGFSWSLICEYFSKICCKHSIFIKIWQE